jgi:hypothetical protein
MSATAVRIIQIAVPFIWLGAVLAISFLEAPLKFRAPGVTLPLGLAIGRLVFRALNIVEVVLAAILTAVVAVDPRHPTVAVIALLASAWAVLGGQILGLRPPLDRRARRVLAGDPPPRSWLHVGYVVAELVKVALLVVLGGLFAGRG